MNIAPVATAALLGLLSSQNVVHAENALPPEAEAVRKYILEKDYPELFKDKPYRTRIANVVIADIDNDGRKDVVVHFHPHYRQSATIVLYRVNESMEVSRVKEGLAPGPLRPDSGDYLDSHTLGLAVDLDLKDKQNETEAREKFTRVAISKFGGVVEYRNFYHADMRSGAGAYVDMTHIPNPPISKTCGDLEFSKVRQIAVGPLKGMTKNHLAAWTEDEIHVYRINAIRDDGRLDKDHWVLKAPEGFNGFVPRMGLGFLSASGTLEILDIRGNE